MTAFIPPFELSCRLVVVDLSCRRYLDNMIKNPDDEKYRKIRKNNKIFAEKVAPVEGAEEFLEAIGFQKTMEEGIVLQVYNKSYIETILCCAVVAFSGKNFCRARRL